MAADEFAGFATAPSQDEFSGFDAAPTASADTPAPRVGWAEENLAGPSELIASTVANIPHAAAHAAVDLYRRWTGGDTEAPDPDAVRAIEVPTGAGGRQLAGDIKTMLYPKRDPNSVDEQVQAIRQKALGEPDPTVADVLQQTGEVGGDVANLLPLMGPAKSVAGKVISSTGSADGVVNKVLSKVADPNSPIGKALAKRAEAQKPSAPPSSVPLADDVPSSTTPPPDFAAPPGAPASSAAAPVTDEALTKSFTPAADDTAARERFESLQRLKQDGLKTVRHSAVSGDKLAAATDYASSKLDKGAGGNAVAEQLSNEKQALTSGVDRLIAGTGGSVGTDSVAVGNRGETILRPLDDLAQKFRDSEKAAYAVADARAAGAPIDLNGVSDLLDKNASVFTRSEAGAQLLRGIQARARELGMWDDANGKLMPATVQQAERLRQYVGGGAYDPHTAGAIRAFKDALAEDVTKAAGADVYNQARATRALRARTLDDPKGIATLLDSSGPDGINRKVPVEKVPDALLRLPDAQFKHVVDTLEHASDRFPELKPQADAALAEIRGHMLQRARAVALPAEKEPWAARQFTDYLQANRAKLARVLKPSELEHLDSLNRNGHYLDIDRRYSGAAVQAHNLATRGRMAIAQHGAASVLGGAGGFVGGHVGATGGAMIGEHLGRKWAASIERAADRKAWAKRVRPL